ncbi:MAG: AzlD domain-containing protein [Minwuia sp.]|nr:AzlD domain-containing protein [Minwuia sp.]
MTDPWSSWIAIAMLTLVVFASRCLGYALGARVPEQGRLRRLLSVLPGCAIAAVVAPQIAMMGPFQMAALALSGIALWFTGQVAVGLVLGLVMLIAGAHLGF